MSTAPNRRAVAVILLIPLMVTLALWAFAWPAARIAPRDLPVGVAGAAPAAEQLEQRFEQRDGAFEVHRYADEAAARAAIEDRVVYGAVVATPQGPHLLTASAASPIVSQQLREAVTASAPESTRVEVTDVVAAPPGDPRGSALGASVLPLALAGMAAGAVVTLMGLRGARGALTLLAASALVGLAAAAVTHSWLGVVTGDWWTEAGVLALTVLAIGSAVAGLAALFGQRGIGLGALLMVLLGNSFSGVTSAPHLLPEPVGAIGQWLPPGAGGSLLRSVAFFDGSAAGGPLLTLSLWSALGLAAVLFARRTPKSAEAAPAATAEPAREPALTG
ncbi:ABC transporter permease [Streptomyces sp. MBT56]|uniref:ABC transporter permease n=1 Tax=unclassified Streptomyces TaxID=2593676 RepID=UPI001909B5F6|nr:MULTISPECIES: ABC transporter permease [unclassified Streptomyces]MBK3559197.1 ABC transporter permease [Streptomyces sp. MBT56]MBK3603762.1 ABC transporter permease [Streptomyces sp. MBT54]MBK3614916.1 ABC transporter permease [Streptomyces sp. MBT98]MBK6044822.1 ABC transporter permease [Streptomyces sp. MBT55]